MKPFFAAAVFLITLILGTADVSASTASGVNSTGGTDLPMGAAGNSFVFLGGGEAGLLNNGFVLFGPNKSVPTAFINTNNGSSSFGGDVDVGHNLNVSGPILPGAVTAGTACTTTGAIGRDTATGKLLNCISGFWVTLAPLYGYSTGEIIGAALINSHIEDGIVRVWGPYLADADRDRAGCKLSGTVDIATLSSRPNCLMRFCSGVFDRNENAYSVAVIGACTHDAPTDSACYLRPELRGQDVLAVACVYPTP